MPLASVVENFGEDVTFVFRHLPLDDVHPHARFAAEASEAADAQDRFWEMHEILMDHQADLSENDILGYERQLGLNLEKFVADLRERRHAPRVDRDIRSADESGAAGTPTFFLNGRRYQGAHNLEALTKAVQDEVTQSVDVPAR